MDHSHRDRTYKKSRFQQELEQSVSRKLISSLLLGCLLFCIAIAVVNALNQNARREDHLESVTSTFHEVYNNTSAFLLDAGHTELAARRAEWRTFSTAVGALIEGRKAHTEAPS